jgi:hypothetical protein
MRNCTLMDIRRIVRRVITGVSLAQKRRANQKKVASP